MSDGTSTLTRPLRIAIVDDEPQALRRLQMAIDKAGDAMVVAQATNGEEALGLIRKGGLDVVLLDIRMPGISGLDLARAIDPEEAPVFIFVTAFSRFAADAFELAAVDYLLKPVEFERLHEALERARRVLEGREARLRIAALEEVVQALRAVDAEAPESGFAEEIWVPDRGDRLRLPVSLIDWVEAERDYVRIHSRGRSFLVRKAIRKLQAELDPEDFLRVHRGALVRRDRIVRLARRPGGPSAVVLQSGAEVPVARRQAAQVRRIVGVRAEPGSGQRGAARHVDRLGLGAGPAVGVLREQHERRAGLAGGAVRIAAGEGHGGDHLGDDALGLLGGVDLLVGLAHHLEVLTALALDLAGACGMLGLDGGAPRQDLRVETRGGIAGVRFFARTAGGDEKGGESGHGGRSDHLRLRTRIRAAHSPMIAAGV